MNNFRIVLYETVDADTWDERAKSLGGSFIHSHAYGTYEALTSSGLPLFVEAIDGDDRCVGIAVATVSSPRYWPFSKYSKVATFGGLPATLDKGPDAECEFIKGLERTLRADGMASIQFASYEAPCSDQVLPRLSYQLSDRAEFYVDLSGSIEQIWGGCAPERRNKVRRAIKRGAETRLEQSTESVRLLLDFQAESLSRRGIVLDSDPVRANAIKEMLIDSGDAELLVTYFDGRPTNAALFTLFGEKVYYSYSGSSRAGNENAGPAHLIWTMIERAKALGRTTLNLGGAAYAPTKDDPGYGLHCFKRDFGATIVRQPAGTKSISTLGSLLAKGLTVVKHTVRR